MEKLSIDEIKRRFTRSFLDVVILRTINESPSWGYGIMEKLRKDHGIKVGSATIYPLLSSLESQGFITSRMELWGRRRKKTYMITDSGKKLLEAYVKFLMEQV